MPTATPNTTIPCTSPTGNLFIRHEPNAIFVAYMSACFYNPTDTTFEKTARMGWFGTLPRVTTGL